MAGCTELDPAIDGILHADGPALATWDLEPATCTADQTGAQTMDAPGGGAVPNVRISKSGSGARIEVRGLARAESVWFGPSDCTTLDVDNGVGEESSNSGARGHTVYSVTGWATIDCATAEGRLRGTLRYEYCK